MRIIFAAMMCVTLCGCETQGVWNGAFTPTADSPVIIGYVDADANGHGRAVVVRYGYAVDLSGAEAYAVLPADAEWRTAWSARGVEGVMFEQMRLPKDRESNAAVAGAAASVDAAGPVPVQTARPTRRFIAGPLASGGSALGRPGMSLIPYDPPIGGHAATQSYTTSPRWLVVPVVVRRRIDQRIGMPIKAAMISPFTLAYDVGTFPLAVIVWGPYTIETWIEHHRAASSK